jgi:hypothetical protein
MGLAVVLFAGILWGAPAAAQVSSVSSSDDSSAARTIDADELPVSLDRIREGLRKAPEQPLLRGLDREADFRVEVREKAKLEEILKKLEFKTGPVPAGGLAAYEQQMRLFSPSERPLMQPYAAFSGGEMVTIAIQNLIARYLGKPLVGAFTDAAHENAEAAAKEEVDRKISAYCASRPDRWNITLCNEK